MQYERLRRRYRAMPLRLKLTLLSTAVVLVVVLAALIGVREGLRYALRKELEVSLRDEAYEVALNAHRPYDKDEDIFEEMAKTSAGHIRHGWFMQLFDAHGKRCLWSSDNTPPEMIDHPIDSTKSEELTRSKAYFSTRLPLHKPGLPVYWIRLGSSTRFIDQDVGNVTEIMLPVLGIILVLAPLAGYLLAARATAPLKKIIITTDHLRPDNLDERLVLRGTGDELDQLSEKINHFLDEIADHLIRNREFVAHAAHELRSPLTAVATSIDVALNRPRSAEEHEELLETILEECRQLTILINQLLVLAESDSGCLSTTRVPVALDQSVLSTLEVFSGIVEESGVVLESSIDRNVVVLGEPSRLRRVVNNLVDNAIKFTPRGGTIFVSLKHDRTQHRVTLTVKDTGIGVPRESLPRLFDRFYQVDTARYHETIRHGTGLGLSITQAIVHAYDGEIRVESNLGEGTTFRVTLPTTNLPTQPQIAPVAKMP